MTDLTAAVRDHVSAEETVDFCRRLVRAPSENPPGDERLAADAVEAILRGIGLETQRVEPAPRRVSVISSWGSADDGPTLLFNGHLDVVPAPDLGDWPYPPYDAVVNDRRLYGRGSSDMKAGIAACVAAVAGLRRAGFKPKGRLLMHLVADEEALGLQGTKFLLDEGWCAGVTEAVVGEPTSMHLVTSERGSAWLRIITEGVSAHGSTPRLGTNAVEHMAHVVLAVQKMRWRKLHEVLGAPTANVGTIGGGSKVNVVPDRCVIEVDRRSIPGETNEEIEGEFEELLDRVRADVPDLKARVEIVDVAEPCETPEDTSIVRLLAAARDALGAEGSELGYGGATDARYLINQGGIPSVIFGPGDIMAAHTTGESVSTDELAVGARVYAHAFARFLGAD